MSSELKAANEVSCRTYNYDPDADDIAAIVGAGKFTVVCCSIVYCPVTDAALSNTVRHLWRARDGQPLIFDTLEEATGGANDKADYYHDNPDQISLDVVGAGVMPPPRPGAESKIAGPAEECPF